MTPEDIAEHEAAWTDVRGILFSKNQNQTARQCKLQAEKAIQHLGASNIAYLMGQAIDFMPKDLRSAEARMDLAYKQIEQFKKNG